MSSKQIKLTNDIKKTKAEMDKLEKSMDQMKNAKVPTQEYAEYQKAVAQTEKQLNSLLKQEQMIKDTGGKRSGTSWDRLQYKIEETRNTLKAYKNDMAYLENSGTAFKVGGDTSQLDAMRSKYNMLNTKLSEYKIKLSEVSAKENQESTSAGRASKSLSSMASSCSKTWATMKKLGSIVGSITSKFSRLASTVVKYSGKAIATLTGINKLMSKGNGHAKRYGMSIGTVLKSIILYQGISKILQGVTTNLWSMLKTNNQFVKSIAQIKGNLLTAFQPIYDACLPAINTLTSALAKATGYLAQFVSLLFGKSVKATQAAASSQYDEAQALKDTAKAAKDAKKQLSDIDELHVASSNNSSDSSSGNSSDSIVPDFSTSIETSGGVSEFVKELKEAWDKADFTEVGVIIGNKINGCLSGINWSTIEMESSKIASSIATFINGALIGIDWTVLGTTIGNGINTGIKFANTGIMKLNWSTLGNSVGTAISSTINTINWDLLGQTFGLLLSGVFSSIDATLSSIDFESLGTNLGSGLQTLLDSCDFSKLTSSVSTGINGIVSFFNNFCDQIDFVGIGSNIASGLNDIGSNIDWVSVGNALGFGMNSAIGTIYGFVSNYDWKSIGTTIATTLNTVFEETDWGMLGAAAGEIVSGLADCIITVIKEFDWNQVGRSIGEMLSGIDWLDVIKSIIPSLDAIKDPTGEVFSGLFESIGENIMDGLGIGMKSTELGSNPIEWLKRAWFWSFVNGFKSLFGIHSPSTLFEGYGSNIMQGLENGIVSLKDSVLGKFTDLRDNIKSYFTNIPTWFEKKFTSATSKIKSAFDAKSIKSHFKSTWTDIKGCFSNVATWFKTTFSKAWTNVKDVFSSGGKIFDGIKDGIGDTFKSVVNKLIDGINAIIATPFNAINGMLNKIHDISILGITPFSSLWSKDPLSVPKIPKLATGTVVPANYGEFAAILGDNKREAEVVSPLSTIKQAVREAMQEMGSSTSDGTPVQVIVQIGRKTIMDETIAANKENQNAGRLHFITE